MLILWLSDQYSEWLWLWLFNNVTSLSGRVATISSIVIRAIAYLSRQMKTYLLVDKGSSDPDITGTLMGRHCQAEQIVHPLEDEGWTERERERY